ncbi:hypothetical protein [Flavobacterium beibuense]|uniref:hypothetical protein n=1 Tax=Flavobacterium beibuense TaxID=657326 RepID=UPI003A947AA6
MSKKDKRQMLVKRGDSTFDKILAHHSNPEDFPLTTTEQKQLDRWRKIFSLMMNHYNKIEIVNQLVKDGLSQSQAYSDIKTTEALFGNVMKANKDFERALFIADTKDFLRRCIQKQDRTNEAKARLLLGRYGDFDKDDDPKFNPAKLENPEIQFDLPPEYMAILKQMMQGGVQDFNKLDVINTEYEELEKEDESTE